MGAGEASAQAGGPPAGHQQAMCGASGLAALLEATASVKGAEAAEGAWEDVAPSYILAATSTNNFRASK